MRAAILLAAYGYFEAPAPITWSPTDHGQFVSITNGNTIAIRNNTGGGSWSSARSDTSRSTGVHIVKFTIVVGETSGNNFMFVGVANGAAALNGNLGADANSAGYWSIGATLYNSGFTGHEPSPAAYGTGDEITMEVDCDSSTVRWKLNGGSYGTTQDISALGPDIYVACSINNDTPFNSVKLEDVP